MLGVDHLLANKDRRFAGVIHDALNQQQRAFRRNLQKLTLFGVGIANFNATARRHQRRFFLVKQIKQGSIVEVFIQ